MRSLLADLRDQNAESIWQMPGRDGRGGVGTQHLAEAARLESGSVGNDEIGSRFDGRRV